MLTADRYARILESFYTGLQGLDVTDYKGQDSDGWTQAVSLGPGHVNAHLEALVELGSIASLRQGWRVHESVLRFAHRYTPDDDSTAQARIHAATQAAVAFLLGWYSPEGSRVIDVLRADIITTSDEWAEVAISFTLQIED